MMRAVVAALVVAATNDATDDATDDAADDLATGQLPGGLAVPQAGVAPLGRRKSEGRGESEGGGQADGKQAFHRVSGTSGFSLVIRHPRCRITSQQVPCQNG